jgi:soluble lytic murein transglycosylase-like protein
MARFDVNVKRASSDSAGAGLPVIGGGGRVPADKGYNSLIAKAAQKWGVPVDLALRQAQQESANFDPNVISGKKKSSAGAIGLFQFMPSTAKALGVDPTNPAQSADKAMGYLAQLFKKFGDWKKAVWAYNWGEGNVAKYLAGQKKALPGETRKYGLIVVDGYTNEEANQTDADVL